MPMVIHIATPTEAAIVAEMATALTSEIIQRTGVQHFNVDLPETTKLCERLIDSKVYVALVAIDNSNPVGFAGLCESHALYTEGTFGIIQEFYVVPGARSAGVGAALIEAATAHAHSSGWRRLELCTPPFPEFQRSSMFYERHGFKVTGGRKMKRII
jgi:GNAT superfamily N-acetyltransferase